MKITYTGKNYHFRQSVIDPSVWTIIPGDPPAHGSPIAPEGVGSPHVSGGRIVYVDDFAIVSDEAVSELVNQAIESKWTISTKPLVPFGSGQTVEYLSVEITAAKDGWLLSQITYCDDLLTKWSMQECRPVASLDGAPEKIEDAEEPPFAEVRLAQRMVGCLNWLATRTRPNIACIVSQLASATTQSPPRAIALGKNTLHECAGRRDHRIVTRGASGETHRPRVGGCSPPRSPESGRPLALECFGDASYEEGYAQTGVNIKLFGVNICWKSTQQPQVPRSTAESECTAMAYAGQMLEAWPACSTASAWTSGSRSSTATTAPQSTSAPGHRSGAPRPSSTESWASSP